MASIAARLDAGRAACQRRAMEIFDRAGRRRARARAERAPERFLAQAIREELAARAELLGLDMGRVLFVGAAGLEPDDVPAGAVVCDPSAALLRGFPAAVAADEDRLPFADGAFTAIIACATLHGVNDLPGALVLMRRALAPGGRLLAGFVGGAALGHVRAAWARAEDAVLGGVSARVGPTVDAAQMAGLMARAGFAEPVVDVAPLRARYGGLAAVARDARAMGDTGWLMARSRTPVSRALWAAAEGEFAALADPDGRVPVEAGLVVCAGRVG